MATPYPGHLLRKGDPKSDSVKALQAQLNLKGCGPIEADGEFGAATDSAVKLFQSRSVDRHGAPLGIDGVVGPTTWEALFGNDTVPSTAPIHQDDPLLAKVVEIAHGEIGVLEVPAYSNGGPRVNQYLASVGLGTGFSWCAAFAYWCYQQAADSLGVKNPMVKTAGCLDAWNRAPAAGAKRIPSNDPARVMAGQVFVMDHGGGLGHMGIVERVDGGNLTTIEGNTGPDGTREGLGVFERKARTIASINLGFLDYSGIVARAPQKAEPDPEATPMGAPEVVADDTAAPPPETPAADAAPLTDVAALNLSSTAVGLLLKAVKDDNYEQPTWVEVEFLGHRVRVGAHALRASVGGRLLRLPVSYQEALDICKKLGWVPPTYDLSDAIWNAATLKLPPHDSSQWDPHAGDALGSRMATLSYVVQHDERIEAGIPANRRAELASTEGKDWVASVRNLTGPHKATTYGWHMLNGHVIQPKGNDAAPPFHNDAHSDYSQTLRPIQRTAKRIGDGVEVDLIEVFEAHGLPKDVLASLKS